MKNIHKKLVCNLTCFIDKFKMVIETVQNFMLGGRYNGNKMGVYVY